MALSREALRQLALAGARTRLQELDGQRNQLLQEFPELRSRTVGARTRRASAGGRKRRLSAAQRRAISERMTKLWAERRKGKAKSKSA
jgi:hypothetical protein